MNLPYHGNPNFLQMPVNVDEYRFALRQAMLKVRAPVRYGLEIGLGWGASALTFLTEFKEAKLFSQDLNDWLPARKKLEEMFPHRFQYINVADSSMWAHDIVEWLYIDGGHEENEVHRDIQFYLPRLKSGGVLCFDDYENPTCPGVKKAVDIFAKIHGPVTLVGGPTGIVYWIKP